MNNLNKKFWKNKKVFITGHSGFKGTWLVLLLDILGSKIIGFSKKEKKNIFFNKINFSSNIKNIYGDINNFQFLKKVIQKEEPDIIIHMAAKSIVEDGYTHPLKTLTTNIDGTINILEISRSLKKLQSILIVTSDKVYKNNDRKKIFKESDILGGDDPYSSSKAAADIISNSYYESFFKFKNIGFGIVRAGNVYGGGDFNLGRLFPDIMSSIFLNKKLNIRNSQHIRPWQHVLDCISRYLFIVEKIYKKPKVYSGAWNIGPNKKSSVKVIDIVNYFKNNKYKLKFIIKNKLFKEKKYIKLSTNKFEKEFGKLNELNLNQGINLTTEWYENYYKKNNIKEISKKQINKYLG